MTSEFWILDKRYTNKLEAKQMKYLRLILVLSRLDKPKK
jgi:hypothetical protein